ncbi:beta-glucosidase [Mycetocola sp. BIGb0189]|uniref:beta-glucosidase family protein n=1 Tax=Mycetocola sp. BIGb0189 TaxID=2940604 RepID=UPI002169513A|nr:glycoside hydrolase family 3 C-terminal domain-containing protein [Mycetocola sp. BIGb0189]MCS4277492.1 beta-glucosidase [Mycetocola sp. BIGb0189]
MPTTPQVLPTHRDGTTLDELIARIPLEQRITLLTGMTSWRLTPITEIGLDSVVVSDGPVGVRGTGETPGETSILLPSPSALSALWDPQRARAVGNLFAREARRHGVDVVLAPQVNIQRTPVGGRHFECFAEDPLLTAEVGSAVVQGLQECGVAACLKHYVANDSETKRTEYVSEVDERTLREVYLAPFEHAVREVGVWSIMAAYNGVDDGTETAPMTEHSHLLRDVLKDELGFDGTVISDWMATNTTVESATGGLDIVMPGPGGPWAENLLAAVRAGEVSEEIINDKVRRILLMAARVGKLAGFDAPEPPAGLDAVDTDARMARELAAAGTVVLRRPDAGLPTLVDGESIALIGPNAARTHVLGGGSSTVHPARVQEIHDGLTEAFPNSNVTLSRGGDSRRYAPTIPVLAGLTGFVDASGNPTVPGAGIVTVTQLDAAGEVLGHREMVEWEGWERVTDDRIDTVVVETRILLDEPGPHSLEVGTVGAYRIIVDGELIAESSTPAGAEVVLDSSVNNPPSIVTKGLVTEPRVAVLRAELKVVHAGGYGEFVRAEFRHRTPSEDADLEISSAVDAARTAQRAVLVVGTNEEVESEGWDRTTLSLPGRQDELVRRVLAVAPETIIVVNAGAPVLLPWLEDAQTVLWAWFPGQEAGGALADVLAGRAEPQGRLPWTLPADEASVPVPHAIPNEQGRIDYAEGVHVGYRGWLRAGATPALPFGFGRGWTDWSYRELSIPRPAEDGSVEVDVVIENVGARTGREVVQVYLEPPVETPEGERPVRWLAGFGAGTVAAGDRATVTVRIPARAFEVWSVAEAGWVRPGGTYRLVAGSNVAQTPLETLLDVTERGR